MKAIKNSLIHYYEKKRNMIRQVNVQNQPNYIHIFGERKKTVAARNTNGLGTFVSFVLRIFLIVRKMDKACRLLNPLSELFEHV